MNASASKLMLLVPQAHCTAQLQGMLLDCSFRKAKARKRDRGWRERRERKEERARDKEQQQEERDTFSLKREIKREQRQILAAPSCRQRLETRVRQALFQPSFFPPLRFRGGSAGRKACMTKKRSSGGGGRGCRRRKRERHGALIKEGAQPTNKNKGREREDRWEAFCSPHFPV